MTETITSRDPGMRNKCQRRPASCGRNARRGAGGAQASSLGGLNSLQHRCALTWARNEKLLFGAPLLRSAEAGTSASALFENPTRRTVGSAERTSDGRPRLRLRQERRVPEKSVTENVSGAT
ncbi:hypothetical protein AAFF_G00309980 [Aldrovandia affinis]|uniref:Uncharacterized protein n=1 Tax=Aldrovandia affinis TaxID=143900 RepID=A0AAD7WR94_9TELE|nr:hypothetical protein AAFF_G00309980 [Aldrovandia affinis]